MKVVYFVLLAVVIVSIRLWTWRRRRARMAGRVVAAAVPRRSVLEEALGEVGLVARREVRERIHGRIFQVGTIMILLIVAAAIVIPVLTKSHSHPTRVGVVGVLSAPLRATLDASAASLAVPVDLLAEPSQAAAEVDLRSGHVDMVVEARALLLNKAISDTDGSAKAQFVRAVARTLGNEQAYLAAGLSPTQAGVVAHAQPLPVVSLQPAARKAPVRGASVISLILVFVMLSQYNTWTLMGVVEEKASRVVEVLLAAVRPVQLLSGKVLGIGLVAFAQASVILAFAIGLAKAVGSDLLHGTGSLALASTLVWLVLGYAFYCWVFAAAGSTAERQEQVQSLVFPLTLPIILGYVVSLTAATSGNASTFFRVLAYLPPTAPFAMPVLVGLSKATWWQFGISAAISIVSTVLVARLATRIYRRAILRTGRRVRLREVFSARAGGSRSVPPTSATGSAT